MGGRGGVGEESKEGRRGGGDKGGDGMGREGEAPCSPWREVGLSASQRQAPGPTLCGGGALEQNPLQPLLETHQSTCQSGRVKEHHKKRN